MEAKVESKRRSARYLSGGGEGGGDSQGTEKDVL